MTDYPVTPLDTVDATAVSAERQRELLHKMMRIRLVEEEVARLVEVEEIICPCHLYIGQEAVAAGVCAPLSDEDHVFSTHRSHGHYLAKGGQLKPMMAELYGRASGCSRGNGGSMHLVAPEVGFMGSSAIVGGSIPLAVGAALAFSIRSSPRVSVAFFGDGAATEGVLYEALNFAALKKLPVFFVCENNLYSTHMHVSAIQANVELYRKAAAFGVASFRVDGNNVMEVLKAAEGAIERARSGEGPSFIECMTYRWRGHVGPKWDLDIGIRTREEVDWWVDNCPVKRMQDFLAGNDMMTDEEFEAAAVAIRAEIDEALTFARESPFPKVDEYRRGVFKP